MPARDPEEGSFIPLIIVILGLFAWIGYRTYVANKGSATAVGTIISCSGPDRSSNAVIWFEFTVHGAAYSSSYTTTCSFCNCTGKPTCLGKKYMVSYATADPTIASLDLDQPVVVRDSLSVLPINSNLLKASPFGAFKGIEYK
jgi:hypothetical protein